MKIRYVAVACSIFFLAAGVASAEQPENRGHHQRGHRNAQADRKKAADWQGQKERMKSRYYQLKEGLEVTQVENVHMQEIVSPAGRLHRADQSQDH